MILREISILVIMVPLASMIFFSSMCGSHLCPQWVRIDIICTEKTSLETIHVHYLSQKNIMWHRRLTVRMMSFEFVADLIVCCWPRSYLTQKVCSYNTLLRTYSVKYTHTSETRFPPCRPARHICLLSEPW